MEVKITILLILFGWLVSCPQSRDVTIWTAFETPEIINTQFNETNPVTFEKTDFEGVNCAILGGFTVQNKPVVNLERNSVTVFEAFNNACRDGDTNSKINVRELALYKTLYYVVE